jgi:peptide/nickel transport system ATP-binding protein
MEARDLVKRFPVRHGLTRRVVGQVAAVDGVSLSVGREETLGLVGESGCGKSTTGRLLTGLLKPTGGSVDFGGHGDITELSEEALRPVRRELQIIFQDPFSSLNPRKTVRQILSAPFRYQGLSMDESVEELLHRVGLLPEHADRYPYEFSGGQAQRIGIARALALRPKLVVCDEPVSALDVSVQAQILNLLKDLQEEFGLSYLFIAHDLGAVRQISSRIAVMYLGTVVEVAERDTLFAGPAHPYTRALLSAVPIPDSVLERLRPRVPLRGELPSPLQPPTGCPFNTRCPRADDRCFAERPVLLPIEASARFALGKDDVVGGERVAGTVGNEVAGTVGHEVACHYPEETAR